MNRESKPLKPLHSLVVAILSLHVAACSSGSGDRGPQPDAAAASAVLGPAGGTLTVSGGPLAGASVTIPPGALDQEVTVEIFGDPFPGPGLIGFSPDVRMVGSAMRIEPIGLLLRERATVVMPGGLVPDPTGGGDPAARRRKVLANLPSRRFVSDAIYAQNGEWQIDEFGGLFVAEYGGDLELYVADFFPNGPTDSFSMGSLALWVLEASDFLSTPPVGLLALARFDSVAPPPSSIFTGGLPSVADVLYLRVNDVGGLSCGGFGSYVVSGPPLIGDRAFPADVPFELLPQSLVVDDRRQFVDTIVSGEHELDVLLSAREPLETPLGIFPDVLQVSLRFTAPVEAEFDLWLASGIGPVQYRQAGDSLGVGGQRSGTIDSGSVFGDPIPTR